MLVNQIKTGVQKAIGMNKVQLTLYRLPLVTDPNTGEQVRNPAGTKTAFKIFGRIAHERVQVPDDRSTPAGESTNLSRFLITDFNNVFVEHDTFTWQGRDWETGPVDSIIIYGTVVGYQAPLKEA